MMLPALGLSGVLALSACGGEDMDMGSMPGGSSTTSATATAGSSAPAAGEHNAADVDFASGMIPHHAQAVEMADMAIENATNPEVKALAGRIKQAQDPEIETMSGWLTSWGEEVPEAGGGMAGMDHGGGEAMGGMMSEQDMTALGEASGSQFDRMWLEMMTAHHEGAVEMARTELAQGSYPQAKDLAQAIIDSQSKEITEMSVLLKSLG